MPVFSPDRVLPRLLPPSHLTWSLLFALVLVVVLQGFMEGTIRGYHIRIAGASPAFARSGGIAPEALWPPVMAASGGLFGLAGFFAVAGTYGRCHLGFSGGLGWNAIACALIAGNRPLALLPACLVYTWLEAGSKGALLEAGLPVESSAFIRAGVLILATVRFPRPMTWGKGGRVL
jgi:simple sugar transport system permease protein